MRQKWNQYAMFAMPILIGMALIPSAHAWIFIDDKPYSQVESVTMLNSDENIARVTFDVNAGNFDINNVKVAVQGDYRQPVITNVESVWAHDSSQVSLIMKVVSQDSITTRIVDYDYNYR